MLGWCLFTPSAVSEWTFFFFQFCSCHGCVPASVSRQTKCYYVRHTNNVLLFIRTELRIEWLIQPCALALFTFSHGFCCLLCTCTQAHTSLLNWARRQTLGYTERLCCDNQRSNCIGVGCAVCLNCCRRHIKTDNTMSLWEMCVILWYCLRCHAVRLVFHL